MNRHRWRVLVAAALITGILYWVGGAGIGAGVVQRQLQELLAGTTTQTVTLDDLSFNPFTLTARFTGLRVDDTDSETGPVLTAGTGHLRLTFNGLFSHAIAVSDFLLDEPRLIVAVSGRFGNHQIHTLGGLQPGATDALKRPPIHIAHAQITNGQLTVYDATESGSPPAPMGIHIGDINLALSNLNTEAEKAASFDLIARINESGVLGVQGNWVPARQTHEAAVQLNDLVLTPFTTLFNTWYPDMQLGGVLSVDGDFRYTPNKRGFAGALVIDELTIEERDGDPLLSASKLTAHGLTIDSGTPVANIKWMELDQPGIAVLVGKDDFFNLRPLMVGTLPQFDKVTVRNGRASFTDTRLLSAARIDANNIAGKLTRNGNKSHQVLTIELTGELADEGTATIDAVHQIDDGQVRVEGNASLGGVDARMASPYIASLIAREITGGLMDLDLHYTIDEDGLVASSKIALADLELDAFSQSAQTVNLPVDLAAALLTDENHRMVLELPVRIASLDSGNGIQKGFGDALAKFISATSTEPVQTLARLASLEVDEAGRIEFAAGSPEIPPEAEHQLTKLVDVLGHRPLLGVRLQGQYAGRTDREALARRQVELHIGLAASTRVHNSSIVSGLDFTDPKVQAVLDEFAVARLDATERKALNTAKQDEDDQTGVAASPSYYPAVFEALVAKETVSDYALRQLARYRARSLVGRLLEMGIEMHRLEVDKKATPVTSEGAPPAVTLTPIAYGRSSD